MSKSWKKNRDWSDEYDADEKREMHRRRREDRRESSWDREEVDYSLRDNARQPEVRKPKVWSRY